MTPKMYEAYKRLGYAIPENWEDMQPKEVREQVKKESDREAYDRYAKMLELIQRYKALRTEAKILFGLVYPEAPAISAEIIYGCLAPLSERCLFRQEDNLEPWLSDSENELQAKCKSMRQEKATLKMRAVGICCGRCHVEIPQNITVEQFFANHICAGDK